MAQLLELTGVSVRFDGVQALSAVSLGVAAGEIVAVIGPNGAGKTSLFNAITGYVELAEGGITLSGTRIDGLTPHEISSRGVRRTFQNGGLFGELTVLENILAGLHGRVGGSLLGVLFGSRAARTAEREAVAEARRLLDITGIRHLEHQLAKESLGRPTAHGRDRAGARHQPAASAS